MCHAYIPANMYHTVITVNIYHACITSKHTCYISTSKHISYISTSKYTSGKYMPANICHTLEPANTLPANMYTYILFTYTSKYISCIYTSKCTSQSLGSFSPSSSSLLVFVLVLNLDLRAASSMPWNVEKKDTKCRNSRNAGSLCSALLALILYHC